MRKKPLSNKEKRELNSLISGFGIIIGKRDSVEIAENEFGVISVNNEAMFFYSDDELIPTLQVILKGRVKLKQVIVDMGAVRFVASGADVMRPGVVDVDDGLVKNDICAVVDVNNKKALAVGRALMDAEEMRKATHGKVVKNLHHVGDEIWQN